VQAVPAVKIIASTGHDEYPLPVTEGVTVTTLWHWDNDEDRDPDALDWQEQTKLECPDVDLTWETVVAIEGEPAAILRSLALLLMDLSFTPGGDDGTYDYWPSGMRFARTIIDAIGQHHPYEDLKRGSNGLVPIWEAIARHVILDVDELGYQRTDSAYELFDKIGMLEEAEKHKP
jgi:hypothetical protein